MQKSLQKYTVNFIVHNANIGGFLLLIFTGNVLVYTDKVWTAQSREEVSPETGIMVVCADPHRFYNIFPIIIIPLF